MRKLLYVKLTTPPLLRRDQIFRIVPEGSGGIAKLPTLGANDVPINKKIGN